MWSFFLVDCSEAFEILFFFFSFSCWKILLMGKELKQLKEIWLKLIMSAGVQMDILSIGMYFIYWCFVILHEEQCIARVHA